MAPPEAPTAGAQQVKIEDVGPSRKRLTITIPADEVSESIETSFAGLASEAQLPGFRPGRAPRRLIEKRFGSAVRAEAKNQLVSSAFSKAVEANNLHVLGEPEGGDELQNLELEAGKAITFTVEVEVPPAFELPSLEGIEILRPIIEVKESDVNGQLERICINEGSLDPRDQAEAGDYCIGRGVMKNAAGDTILDIDGAVIQVPPADKGGKGAILGVAVDDFSKQIGSPKAGDVVRVSCTGPENHEDERIRGQALKAEFTVSQVNRILPATPDQLRERFGFADEAQLRESIRQRLDRRAEIEQQVAMRSQISAYFYDNVTMDLPQRLTAREAARNLERTRLDLLYRGVDAKTVEERMVELRARTADAAVRELKVFFVLARASQALQLQVTNEEIGGRIAQIAAERGMRQDQLVAELKQRNQLGLLAQQVLEHKTYDAILKKAKITDTPVDEFNKVMAKKRGEGVSLS